MKNTMKQALSLLLTLVLLLQLFPCPAFAAEATGVDEPSLQESVPEEPEETQPTGEGEVTAPTEPQTEAPQPDAQSGQPDPVTEAPSELVQSPTTAAETEPVTEAELDTEPVTESATDAALPEEEVSADAGADGTASEEGAEPEDIVIELDLSFPDDGVSNDELLNEYLYETGRKAVAPPMRFRGQLRACDRLEGLCGIFARELENRIPAIAAGEERSSVFTIDVKDLTGLEGWEIEVWNAASLGVSYIYGDGQYNEAAKKACLAKIKSASIHTALLTDLPYELYWYDKTYVNEAENIKGLHVGITLSPKYMPKASGNGTELCLFCREAKFKFVVAEAYRDTDGESLYTLNQELCQSVKGTADTAADVVRQYQDLTDFEKLCAYRDEICNRVYYNSAAAHDSSMPYGNPWQLIWVFDDDPTTNVVCEGYSKAFQYLCDLSQFRFPLTCYSVCGSISGGKHMWNIVTMRDGQNYLVDVTNCDGWSNPNRLFLVGYSSGSVENGYYCSGNRYRYDDSTLNFFTNRELTLADHAYQYPIPLSGCTVTVDNTRFVYDGAAKYPAVTVSDHDNELSEGIDYTLSYSDNVNAGEACITITGMGEYTGTLTRSFSIAPISIDTAQITVAALTYDRAAHAPQFTVVLDGQTLTAGTDCTAGDFSATEAGSHPFTVNGVGNYSGEVEAVLVIEPADLSDAVISAPGVTYDGAEHTAEITVTLDGQTLTAGTDYTVAPVSGTAAGHYPFTVTGTGNYTGTAQQDFVIAEKPLEGANITIQTQTYTGGTVPPALSVELEGVTLAAGTDYTTGAVTVTEEGERCFSVTGTGNYCGTIALTFRADAISLEHAAVTVEPQTYSGAALSPRPSVVLNQTELTEGVDYTLNEFSRTEAGTYAFSIVGMGSYCGTVGATFRIDPLALQAENLSFDAQLTYNGRVQSPAVAVRVGSQTLTEGTDFVVTADSAVDVGSYSLTVTGQGNYRGTLTQSFSILERSLTGAVVTATARTFTGDALTPAVTVKLDGMTLTPERDYTLNGFSAAAAGSHSFTVTGKGNYSGTETGLFVIDPADLSGATVSAGAVTYDGTAQEPVPTVELDGVALENGTDFTLSYRDNTAAGTGSVTVTGQGNYTGTATGSFDIEPVDLSGAVVTVDDTTYNGTAREPEPSVTLSGKPLIMGTDFSAAYRNNITIGTAEVTISGIGNYCGTATGSFKIAHADLSRAVITADDVTYDGSEQTPEPDVTLGNVTLKRGRDYTLTYQNNVNAGTASVTINGTGNYIGTATGHFTIEPQSLDEAEVSAANQPYTGAALSPVVLVVLGQVVLRLEQDYILNEFGETEAGSYFFTVTGVGNYTDTAEGSFTIDPVDLSDAVVSADDAVYDGTEQEPAPTVMLGDRLLSGETDYEVLYSDNIDAGTAEIIIIGEGNYSGTATGHFTITPADLSGALVTADDVTYDGTEQEPEPTVTLGALTPDELFDYTVTYQNNVSAGTASVTVSGTGNYTGTATGQFTIAPADLSSAVVTAADGTYNGSALQPTPTVTLDDMTLRGGTDYTVDAYRNNTDAGTATVRVRGVGNYTGTATGRFTIAKAEQNLTVSCANSVFAGKTVKVTGEGFGSLSFSSSNTAVATVNAQGVVTGRKYGTATITVTAAGDRNHNAASKSVRIKAVCAAPKLTSVVNVKGGVKVSWGKVSGAAAYRVFYKTGSGRWMVAGSTTATSFVCTKTAKSGTTYTFTVRCVNSIKGSTFTSTYDSTGLSVCYLSPPALSKLNSSRRRTIAASWGAVSGAAGYQVQCSPIRSFSSETRTATLKGRSKTVTSLTRGKVYYVRVRCYRKMNGRTVYSAWSAVRSMKCP